MPTDTRPRAGQYVTVTRPDGVTYEALLQRYDGPHGGLAVLYSDPPMCPDGEPLYEHTVQVSDLCNDALLYRLAQREDDYTSPRDVANALRRAEQMGAMAEAWRILAAWAEVPSVPEPWRERMGQAADRLERALNA